MSSMDDITRAIIQLPFEQIAGLRDWLAELAERRWDEQIERDEKAGKRDALADEALAEYHAGRPRPFRPMEIACPAHRLNG